MREKRRESSEGEQAISLSEDELRKGGTEGGNREELRVKAEATIIQLHFSWLRIRGSTHQLVGSFFST